MGTVEQAAPYNNQPDIGQFMRLVSHSNVRLVYTRTSCQMCMQSPPIRALVSYCLSMRDGLNPQCATHVSTLVSFSPLLTGDTPPEAMRVIII